MSHFDFLTAIVRFETDLWNTVDDRLHDEGEQSLAVVHTLHVVHEAAGHCRVQDISDEIGITVGAASKMVDRLETAGLIARASNPDDRRSSLITLTEAGAAAHENGAAAADRLVVEILGDEPELARLTPLLLQWRSRLAAR